MNIHPIFVHFPIALLSMYAFFECLRFKKLLNSPTWVAIKAIFLVLGTLSALAALQTGETAEQILGRSDLIQMHSLWASIATYIFGFLALIYISIFINQHHSQKLNQKVLSLIIDFQKSFLITFVALTGLIALTIAGGLGGAIVYGSNVDPIVQFIYEQIHIRS